MIYKPARAAYRALPIRSARYPVSLYNRRSVMERAEAKLWREEFTRRQMALVLKCPRLEDYTAGLPAIMEEMFDWVPGYLPEAR